MFKKTDLFKTKFIKVHGNTYDYSKVICSKGEDKVDIICTKHGLFSQRAFDHARGHGCKKCGRERAALKKINMSKKLFLNKVNKIHKNKYDYSKTIYTHNADKITIICPEHGEFFQTASVHLHQKGGCPRCSPTYQPNTFEFIKTIKNLYGDKYDYSKVVYKTAKTKVNLFCQRHGSFEQNPNNLLNGHGCPVCGFENAVTGFKPNEPAILYYIQDIDTSLYKIGITKNTLKVRFPGKNIKVISIEHFKCGYNAREKEKHILKTFIDQRICNLNFKDCGGSTEFFKIDILKLDKGNKNNEISPQKTRE